MDNHDSQQQATLSPNVAKLMRGELLPISSPITTPKVPSKKFEDVRKLEHYKEQVQICVANPGRFNASWTLLSKLFGEAELYDYIRKSAWTKEDLKNFEIVGELDNENQV
ncbi:hypothetical protein Mgra_00005533 [Meloidogyne graminicola]|uniref:Uncharacterized protein n=1 Tax=Meloidogyne graminicola TaxID=189291 RepID=A0A8S9ZPF6_9BILA|nr:hypothetical protein Mgra_00005533 [Meloidogyne graminicola]